MTTTATTITGEPQPYATAAEVEWFAHRFDELLVALGRVMRDAEPVCQLALVAVFSEGHVLVEDVPGVGKTTLAKCIATGLGSTWGRIQFTPDLLPSDITGVSIWDERERQFEFRPGPVFANVVVGDEINRASPKTQSALLEVMEERQVTVDGVSHAVPMPFTVMATQNPIDFDGTYRLPDAQLDRFLVRISVGYPSADEEAAMLDERSRGGRPVTMEPVVDPASAEAMIAISARIAVDPSLSRYVVDLADATRRHPAVRLGVSPRASLALLRAAQTRAAAGGRTYVVPEDVKELVPAVWGHRLVATAEADLSGGAGAEVLRDVVARTAGPPRT